MGVHPMCLHARWNRKIRHISNESHAPGTSTFKCHQYQKSVGGRINALCSAALGFRKEGVEN